MTDKLVQGDKIPAITLRLAGGGEQSLPEALTARYLVLLFFRGHWCPYCRRHLQSYQAQLSELEALGVMVIGATVDSQEETQALAASLGLTFPLAYGVTDEEASGFAPWVGNDDHGHYLQPMEFLVLRGGTLFGTLYASGPIGRMAPEDVLNAIRMRERRRVAQEQGEAAASG